MHCDWVNISVPEDSTPEVDRELRLILGSIGALSGLRQATGELHKLSSGGTLKKTDGRGFSFYGASGAFLEALRANDLFDNYLSVFASVPHSVTRMDIAHDVFTDAPPVLRKLYSDCKKGKIQLTRKRLSPGQFSWSQHVRDDGADSGTVYLGRRTSEVYAKVYDKLKERQDAGFSDYTTPTTRYELTVSGKQGISLADVQRPVALFWRYMSGILPRPKSVPDWSPLDDAGFSVRPRRSLLPAEVLKQSVEDSLELDKLIGLARDIGPHGYDYFLSLLASKSGAPDLASA